MALEAACWAGMTHGQVGHPGALAWLSTCPRVSVEVGMKL